MNNVTELPPPTYYPAHDERDENGMIGDVQYPKRTPKQQAAYDRWVAAGKPQIKAGG